MEDVLLGNNEKKALAQWGCANIRGEWVPAADAHMTYLSSEVFQATVDIFCTQASEQGREVLKAGLWSVEPWSFPAPPGQHAPDNFSSAAELPFRRWEIITNYGKVS